jgi:Rod binding domain-containing protein
MDPVAATGRFAGALPPGVPAPTSAGEKALWEQSKQFEAVFVRQLVSQMLEAARAGDESDGSNQAYQSMADEQMTQGLVDSGSFGLAGSLYGFLRTQASAVAPAAPATGAGAGEATA